MSKKTHRWSALALLTSAALVASACGSDSDSSSSSASSSSAAASTAAPLETTAETTAVTGGGSATTGATDASTDSSSAETTAPTEEASDDLVVPSGDAKTIKIMVIAPEDTPTSNLPDMRAGAEAAAQALADAGSTVTVEIEYCNDKGDANEATTCARKVTAEYAAVIASGRAVQQEFDVVAPLGVPFFSAVLGAPAASNPGYFNVDGGLLAGYASAATATVNEGYSTIVTIATDLPVTQPYRDAFKSGAEAAGGSVVGEVLLPPTAITDYAPYVAQVEASGADAVCMAASTSGVTGLSQAMKQAGIDMIRCVPYENMPLIDQERMGDLLDGVISGGPTPPILLEGATPGIQRYLDELEAAGHDPAALAGTGGLRTWATVQVVAVIADEANGTDAASITEALNASGPVKVPALGTWTPSAVGPADIPRYSNIVGHGFVFDGTTPSELADSPYDLFEVFGG